MNYDIIGDIHGQCGLLEQLLASMGYRETMGAWRHPERMALFIGDFVDRGPRQLDTLKIVRSMRDAGSAMAVMGNHELNAIGWMTPSTSRPGSFLRRRDGAKGASNRHHHKAFLEQVGEGSKTHMEWIEWFKTLPLWLDLPELHAAHACWHPAAIARVKKSLGESGLLSDEWLDEALSEPDVEGPPAESLFSAVELICKGVEVSLPRGLSYVDQDGFSRTKTRSRWWDPTADTFHKSAMLKRSVAETVPDFPIPESAKIVLPDAKPVFFGHYWLGGTPAPLAPSAACVDYSAAKAGPLVAYRHEGEFLLEAKRFAWNPRP